MGGISKFISALKRGIEEVAQFGIHSLRLRWAAISGLGMIATSLAFVEFFLLKSQGNIAYYIHIFIFANMALALAAMIVLAIRFLRVLDAFQRGVREIIEGNLDYRIMIRSRNEIWECANAFNDMAASLKTAIDALGFANEELGRRVWELTLLRKVSEEMTSTLDLDHLFPLIVRDTCDVLEAEICSLMLIDGDGALRIKHARGLDEDIVRDTRIRLGEGIAGWVAENKCPLLIDDIEKDPRFSRLNRERYFTKSLLSVPLKLGDRILGVINVNNKRGGRPFDGDDRNLLETLASHAAIAIENAKLYRNVWEQAHQLQDLSAQLIQSGKLAGIGEIAGSIAHEIGGTLGIILNRLQLVRSRVEILPEDLRGDLETIERQVRKAIDVSRNLLRFAHHYPLSFSPVNVNDALEEVLELLGKQLNADRIEVNRTYGEVSEIEGNRNQLQQVFLNIILNARDAMPGGGTLSIDTSNLPDGSGVEIRFRDTGVGIPEDIGDKIFNPFFTTKEADKGTGLGLSVSSRIVKDHGGTISFESEIGVGTTFIVRLPARNPNSRKEKDHENQMVGARCLPDNVGGRCKDNHGPL
ncbi:MAG: ATP-binding protein [bacterium]